MTLAEVSMAYHLGFLTHAIGVYLEGNLIYERLLKESRKSFTKMERALQVMSTYTCCRLPLSEGYPVPSSLRLHVFGKDHAKT